MPRQVELRLEALLQEFAPETRRVELSELLGIGEATLRAYIENRWTVLDRTVLERLADFFQCEAGSLLATSESRFFDAFKTLSGTEAFPDSPTCLYLRRPDADRMSGGRSLAYRDHLAIKHVGTLLRDGIDGLAELEACATTPEQFHHYLRQNCVVVGSPMVNPAAEMALCRAFGVGPFTSGNAALPFTFKIGESMAGPSSILEQSSDGKRGIWLREQNELLEVDHWPPGEFKRLRIKRGRDCAAVVILNYGLAEAPASRRKLIVLCGFGGAGTEAAARALSAHYRDLEPLDDEGLVWGVIEVFYWKGANSTERKDLTYNWRYRVGGRCPVAFVNRPR
jgi:hypothetical protein